MFGARVRVFFSSGARNQADHNSVDSYGYTPLQVAERKGNPRTAHILATPRAAAGPAAAAADVANRYLPGNEVLQAFQSSFSSGERKRHDNHDDDDDDNDNDTLVSAGGASELGKALSSLTLQGILRTLPCPTWIQ